MLIIRDFQLVRHFFENTSLSNEQSSKSLTQDVILISYSLSRALVEYSCQCKYDSSSTLVALASTSDNFVYDTW